MMEFPIAYPGFEGQQLAVKSRMLAGPQLLLNGVPVQRVKGVYTLKNNAGVETSIRLKMDYLDMAVPKVLINGQAVQILPPLKRLEQIAILAPLVLMIVGGALGGAIGAAGAFVNANIFRSPRSTATKYNLAGGVFIVSLIVYSIFATLLQSLMAD